MLAVVSVMGVAGTSWGQAPPPPPMDQRWRYQLDVMERVLETAVEHGATEVRNRLQAVAPTDMLLSEGARVRGFRLEGYGVFFDVEVPNLEGTLTWAVRTLDQTDLTLNNALSALRSHIEAAGDTSLQQAFKRVELQVAPISVATGARTTVPASNAPSTAAAAAILRNPNEIYRTEVIESLARAMLEYSRGLNVAPTEWLTVAARRNDSRPRLAMPEPDVRTVMIKVRGSDLAAFLAGQLSLDDARQRMEVRVF
jgi:hypothetical protein